MADMNAAAVTTIAEGDIRNMDLIPTKSVASEIRMHCEYTLITIVALLIGSGGWTRNRCVDAPGIPETAKPKESRQKWKTKATKDTRSEVYIPFCRNIWVTRKHTGNFFPRQVGGKQTRLSCTGNKPSAIHFTTIAPNLALTILPSNQPKMFTL